MTSSKPKRSRPAERQGDAGTYTGTLAEPLPQWTALTQPPPEEVGASIDAKMKALLEHYQINPRDAFEAGPRQVAAWANLAFALAREHVPGLQGAPNKQGRPKKRQEDDLTLFLWVELLKRRDGLSQTAAVRRVAKEGWVDGKAETLKKRYEHLSAPYLVCARVIDRIIEGIGAERTFLMMQEALTDERTLEEFLGDENKRI
jgi:hypothetical protein